MIQTGQLAPAFNGKTFRGEPIDLASYRGKKVWLGFYRWASCPLCNLRISEVIQQAKEFEEAGIQLIAVFHSPPENIASFVGTQNPPFPIVADPTLELYQRYGVAPRIFGLLHLRVFWRAFRGLFAGFIPWKIDTPVHMVPADFLVDPEGLIYQAYYGDAVSDHIPFDDVRTFGADLCLDMPEPAV